MSQPSPFARGFRAVRSEPSVLLAEIGWRWLFGGIATALMGWAVLLFLKSVEVSRANQLLLSTLNPQLIIYAFAEMFRNKWGVLARAGLTLGIGLSFLWIVTASVARTATTRVLLERSAEDYGEQRETRSNLRAVIWIQMVRVGLLWCGLAAYVLAALAADRVTRGSSGESHIGAFLLVFFTIVLVAAAVLSFINWFLLLAPIFAIRDDLGFSDATIAAWRLSRDRAGSLAVLNLAHSGIRMVWLVVMTGLAFTPLGFLHILPKALVFGAIMLVSLVYLGVADILFVARYAGYIDIAEQERHPHPVVANGVAPVLAYAGEPVTETSGPEPETQAPEPPAGFAEP